MSEKIRSIAGNKALWLYAASAVFLAAYAALFNWADRSATDDYTLYLVNTNGVLILPALGFGVSVVLLMRRKHTLLAGVLLAVAVVYCILGLLFVTPGYGSRLTHVTSVRLNEHVYHLARPSYDSSLTATYPLFECDSLGLVCHVIHREEFWLESLVTPTLAADPAANTVSLLFDGAVVYTYPAE